MVLKLRMTMLSRLYKKYESYLKSLNTLAIPLLVTYLNNMLFSLGDEVIVTRTGQDYYAIASLITMYIYYITGAISCISIVINIVGGKEADENTDNYKHLLSTSFSFIFIVGLCVFIINVLFGYAVLNKYYHFTGNVLKQGYIYLVIQSITIIINGFIFVFSAHFRNTKNMKIITSTVAKTNIINIIIDVVLVFGLFGMPKLGIVGAGIGTLVGCGYTMMKYNKYLKKNIKIKMRIYKVNLKEIWVQFLPLYMQELLEYTFVYMVLSYIIASISIESIGIFNFYNSILNILLLPVFAYGSALLTLTAQHIEDIQIIRKISILVMSVYWSVICIVFIIFGYSIFFAITGNAEFSVNIYKYVGVVFGLFIFNVLQTLMRYNVQGLKLTKTSYVCSMIVNVLICLLLFVMLKMNLLSLYSVYIVIGVGNCALLIAYINIEKLNVFQIK